MYKKLKEQGYYIYRNVLSPEIVELFQIYADRALEGKEKGDSIHAIVENPELLTLLYILKDKEVLKDIEKYYFASKFIINSFSVLNNIHNNQNFSANIHRDIRFFSGNCNLMLNMLIMLDDFTEENGATRILPRSHKTKELSILDWNKYSKQITGKAGDIIIWNSNLFHCSESNTTDAGRRAIPIVFQKSAMKQLLNYPKSMKSVENTLSEEVKQLLGWNSQVPESLEEWYSPNRTYKKNQD